MKKLALLSLFLFGCGGSAMAPPQQNSQFVAGFNPPAVQPGYNRYIAPAVNGIPPGTDVEYCQWVAPAVDSDGDVTGMVGAQSKGGHHAVLYASTKTGYKVGESHICTEDDMVSFSFLGAIGGAGVDTNLAPLPAGLVFRLRKGLALVINAHYINATQQPIDGQSLFDIQLSAPSPTRTVADLFANEGDIFTIPPGQTLTYDTNCVMQQDLSFAMVTNHMHQYGVSALSEVIHMDGTHETAISSPTWSPEMMFNPTYVLFSMASPLVAKKGDTYHTRCTWTNTTGNPLAFPVEMCAGPGFYFPGNGSITCSDGDWSAGGSGVEP
jgi:hypothetical protein